MAMVQFWQYILPMSVLLLFIATCKHRDIRAEEKADKFLYPNYGMTAPGPAWLRWTKSVKNAANTSVLALPDRLLALWEGGLPHSLDLQTLETQGTDDLGSLESGSSYSAHCKRDPITGNIFNFGITQGVSTKLNL